MRDKNTNATQFRASLQNVPMIERIVRTYAGRFNRYINVGHWFTNAIYISKNAKKAG